jgi:hypothetical protein
MNDRNLNANALHKQRQKACRPKPAAKDPYKTLCACGHRLGAHVSGWALTMTGKHCDKCNCTTFQPEHLIHST